MHCQLRQTNVDGRDADASLRQHAKGRSACRVRAVEKHLCFHASAFANGLHDSGGHGVGGISLIRVVFNHKPAAKSRLVGGVCFFRVVRVHGVGVIHRNKEATRECFVQLVLVQLQSVGDTAKCAFQEVPSGARCAFTADFLVVEESAYANTVA